MNCKVLAWTKAMLGAGVGAAVPMIDSYVHGQAIDWDRVGVCAAVAMVLYALKSPFPGGTQ